MRLLNGLVAVSTLFTSVALAQQQNFQDWAVASNNDHSFVVAMTFAGQDVGLAEYCSTNTGQCFWQLMLPIGCAKGTVTPVLGSTQSGAVSLDVECTGNVSDDGQNYFYEFSKWQDLEGLMKDSANVIFAFPMKDGEIKVAHFSLAGRTDAMALAESVAMQASKQQQQQQHPASGLDTPADVHL